MNKASLLEMTKKTQDLTLKQRSTLSLNIHALEHLAAQNSATPSQLKY